LKLSKPELLAGGGVVAVAFMVVLVEVLDVLLVDVVDVEFVVLVVFVEFASCLMSPVYMRVIMHGQSLEQSSFSAR
jgi:hypothetical protein